MWFNAYSRTEKDCILLACPEKKCAMHFTRLERFHLIDSKDSVCVELHPCQQYKRTTAKTHNFTWMFQLSSISVITHSVITVIWSSASLNAVKNTVILYSRRNFKPQLRSLIRAAELNHSKFFLRSFS